MLNKKDRKFLITIFFVLIVAFTVPVKAAGEEFVITKETDKIVEGVIKSQSNENESPIQASSGEISGTINVETFYYSQLKSSVSRSVYNALKTDTTGIGTVQIPLTNQKYSIDISRISDTNYIQELSNKYIKGYVIDAIVAFCNDNPKIYWYYGSDLSISTKINKKTGIIEFDSLKINSLVEERNNYKQFNKQLEEAADSINGTSVYEIVKKCHDYVCNTVVYTKKPGVYINQTAYDALVNKQGVCDAQARLFKLLCDAKGIKCVKVDGYAGNTNEKGGHAWNYIYHPDEKKWYAIDVTWDNNKVNGKATTYSYLLVGKNTPIKYESGTYLFSQNHIPGIKNMSIQTYIPVEPELSDEAYEKFYGRIAKSNTRKTNQPVTVTISVNRELQSIPTGWILSDNKKILSKTYQDNVNTDITLVNVRGEKISGTVNISNIDREAPKATVSYKQDSNGNIETIITANEEIQETNGWTLSEDKKVLSKTYIENKTENINIKDLAGNESQVAVNIGNVENQNMALSIIYSTKSITNKDIVVSIVSNKKLQSLQGWTLSEDKKSLIKIYTENKKETVIVKDIDGNEKSVVIEINNIDKVKPNLKVAYSELTKDGTIIVTISADKELEQKDSWILSQDKKTLTKVYDTVIKDVIVLTDLAGNEQEVNVEITQMQLKTKEDLKDTEDVDRNNGTINKTETTKIEINDDEATKLVEAEKTNRQVENKAKEVIDSVSAQELKQEASKLMLPYTGSYEYIKILMALVAVTGIISYIKYKKSI